MAIASVQSAAVPGVDSVATETKRRRRMRSLPLSSVARAATGGLVTELAFSSLSWWPAALVGVALFVLPLRRGATARRGGALGFVWGIAFFLPHIWWANEAVGPLPWLGLAALEAGIIGLGAGAAVIALRPVPVRRKPVVGAAVFGVVWVATEQVRQVWPFGGFPWGRLAFSQVDGPLVGLAPVGGAPLVSFVVATLAFLVAEAWVRLRSGHVAAAVRAGAGAGVAVVLVAAIPLPVAQEVGTLRVAAVQGNVSTPGLDAFAQAREVLDNHVDTTTALAREVPEGGLDLVLWPENASDINPRVDKAAAADISAAASRVGAPILLGTDRRTEDARYNDMVLWDPTVGSVFAYSKQVPAAFGEYIPFRSFFRLFSPEVDRVRTDMARGTEPAVVPVPVARLGRTVSVGTPICFEVAYDAVVRGAVLAGAEVLVVPTNNASFGYTAESTQQLAMSRFRAVEHGRATVQISTVGVSGVIRPDGALVERTDLFTQDRLLAELPLRTTVTLSDRLGDLPTTAAVLAAATLVLSGLVASRRRRAR